MRTAIDERSRSAPSATRIAWFSLAVFLLTAASALAGSNPDFDLDGVGDAIDNCSITANAAQDDSDADFCGNLCDADYDQSGVVGYPDFGIFFSCFGTGSFNCYIALHFEGFIGPERAVGFTEFGFFTANYGTVPGPSGSTPGTVACP
jgi:hypothetical protein